MRKTINGILFVATVMVFITGSHASGEDAGLSGAGDGFDMTILHNELQNSSIVEEDSGVVRENEKENPIAILIRILLYLLLVIVLISGISWLFKRIGLPGTIKNNGPGSMDLLEVLPISQNRTITIVRILDAVYILGQSQGAMVLIDKVEGQKALELISTSKGGTAVTQFKDAINSFMDKFKKNS
ncbi:MAG: flagellar biosynthetic protein FliO [Chitinispirillaceae bacterium]|nr:flagellar biosynthetic protein FliO [Chitinispirillaceae bacterium]